MVQAQLQYFRPVLKLIVDGIQLDERLPGHAQLGIPASSSEVPFEIHAWV
jgi:hypothetical protein